jgi:predicted transcriptional regulator
LQLKKIPGVVEAYTEMARSDTNRLIVTMNNGEKTLPEVMRILVNQNVEIQQCKAQSLSLEAVFIQLVKAAKKGEGLSSDELASMLGLSRGTVVHHLNRLMESGLVVANKNTYNLRVNNLEVLIDELQRDAERALDDLRTVAKDIDERLGL